jgi:hypothetical protein
MYNNTENYVSLKRNGDKLIRTQNKPGAKSAIIANGIKHFSLRRRQFEPQGDNLLSSIAESTYTNVTLQYLKYCTTYNVHIKLFFS